MRHPLAAPLSPGFLLRCLGALLLALALGGCAGNTRLKNVRDFAAQAPKLNGYAELSERWRDTYQRESPYLSPAADERERTMDRERHAAYPDLTAIHKAVTAYMRMLGALAEGGQFDPGDQIKEAARGIKAWPDTGLTDRHVNAISALTRAVARGISGRMQDRAVQDMLREGYEPMRDALDAMSTVLRYYDKHHDNEQAIVLGTLDTEIPFADRPPERLLAALAKVHRQQKAAEYRLLGLRHTLAAQHVEDIRALHEALYRQLEPVPAAPPVRVAATSLQGAAP